MPPPPPETLPLKPLPPVWGGPRNPKNPPLYGLAWRSSLSELSRKYGTTRLCAIPDRVFVTPFLEQLDAFEGKIIYSIQFRYDDSAPDDNDQLCFLTFNDREKNLATLGGPDGDKFLEIMKNMMKMTKEEESTLMWYRCARMVDTDFWM
ncbi:hypothetical protein C8R46DRAFT_1216090 [Mycena filopes]|nr:hypothetical protein C8R46DRAFT_1216090 [Mycena filopes]